MLTFGERIVFLREELGISQKELAGMVGITAATLSRYENNIYEPKSEIVALLASALNSSADYLLGLSSSFQTNSDLIHFPEITKQEYKLIKCYRLLNDQNKIRLEERALTLLECQ